MAKKIDNPIGFVYSGLPARNDFYPTDEDIFKVILKEKYGHCNVIVFPSPPNMLNFMDILGDSVKFSNVVIVYNQNHAETIETMFQMFQMIGSEVNTVLAVYPDQFISVKDYWSNDGLFILNDLDNPKLDFQLESMFGEPPLHRLPPEQVIKNYQTQEHH